MKNASKLLNQLKRNINELNKNSNTKQIQNKLNNTSKQLKKSLNSTSKQIQESLNHHYQNSPHYKSQLQSQLKKAKQHSQQKFHEVSQSNPTIKHYHHKYQNISKQIPKLNIKESIDSTAKRSKTIASNVQSKAKQISNTSTKITSAVSNRISNISPTKAVTSITKPIYSTLKATQRMITPNRWIGYLSKMKTWLMIYGFVGIASLMVINQLSYMGLLYLVRHRYDEDNEASIFGVNMVWIYKWLNIPYHADIKHQRQKLIDNKDEDDYDILDEIQMQDYNVTVDIKLTKMAYNALLYPRIVSAAMLTFVIGTPLLRVVVWFKR